MAVFAPLLPIVILFIRRAAPHPILSLLRITCIVVFIQNLAIAIPALTTLYLPFISAIFRLAELSLLYFLLVQAALPKRLRDIMVMLLVSFVSVVITIYAFRGANAYPTVITAIESSALILLSLISLMKLISNRHIVLFQQPLFWIAGGVICYFGTFLFIEGLTRVRTGLSQNVEEKLIVFWIAGISRFLFFSLAAYVAPVKRNDLHQ